MKRVLTNWKNIAIIALSVACIGLSSGIGYYFYKVGTFGIREDIGGYAQVVSEPVSDKVPYEKNIIERYSFPDLERMDTEGQETLIQPLQVMQKIDVLGLDTETFKNPENGMFATANRLDDVLREYIDNSNREKVEYRGTSGSELQKIINSNVGKDIYLLTDVVDECGTIDIPSNTHIYANQTKFIGDGNILFKLDHADNVVLDGFVLDGGYEDAVYAVESTNVVVRNATISGLQSKALVFIAGQNLFIQNNEMVENLEGGIHITGFANDILIEGNTIEECHGTWNYTAGIVLSGLYPSDVWHLWTGSKKSLIEDGYAPHNAIIRNNVIKNNYANGIYSDGAFLCYYTDNQIMDNDKEGLCLDCGSLGNYVAENSFIRNGRRNYQADQDLAKDYVLSVGRMEDGSSTSKIPGVSLDNGAYNIIKANLISNNYGGGIKCVRACVRNLIMENTLIDNNIGENEKFHFFGIELGTAVADEKDKHAKVIDYAPSFENIVARNTISGNHYAGVFISTDGYCNDIFDNIIMDCGWFSVEAISAKFNSIVNNFSNVDMRNEYQQ